MRTSNFKLMTLLAAIFFTGSLIAQGLQPELQYFRYRDQRGINVFEAPNDGSVPFEGLKIRIGADFTQQMQMLSHESGADTTGGNILYPLGSGFNTATANLNFDIQLADGILVSLENYMSSRHHTEFWVKGGYIQIDRIPFWENTAFFDDHIRVKIGHMEVNYGDQHFRRMDNGRAIYNPFVGNYIFDAFATEIGGEVYYFNPAGFFGMVGMTAGLIKGDVQDYTDPASSSSWDGKKGPSILLKLGYDNNINDNMRLRITYSLYTNSGTPRNTLYGGDRTGSAFTNVMIGPGGTSTFTNGRLNPGFNNRITANQINVLFVVSGLEVFGTYEMIAGERSSDSNFDGVDNRTANQYAIDVVYRFLENEQMFIGVRQNGASYEVVAGGDAVNVSRTTIGVGWFPTRNLLLKGSYVMQNYGTDGWSMTDLYYDGSFNGIVIEAVVGL